MTRTILKISGGAGSWAAGRKWCDENPGAPLELLFTDTLCEDQDTYRFLIAGAANLLGVELPPGFLPKIEDFPAWEDRAAYKAFVLGLAARTMMLMPAFHWNNSDEDIFDVFRRKHTIGNSRFDLCSAILKRERADRWFRFECDPINTVVLVGLGPAEIERWEGASKRDRPGLRANMAAIGRTFRAPLCEPKVWYPHRVEAKMLLAGLWVQRLYRRGFGHANCGSACVKAGLGHWRRVEQVFPERYAFVERFTAEMVRDFDALPFLTDRRRTRDNPTGAKRPLSLAELRTRKLTQLEAVEMGGCRCALGDDPNVIDLADVFG